MRTEDVIGCFICAFHDFGVALTRSVCQHLVDAHWRHQVQLLKSMLTSSPEADTKLSWIAAFLLSVSIWLGAAADRPTETAGAGQRLGDTAVNAAMVHPF